MPWVRTVIVFMLVLLAFSTVSCQKSTKDAFSFRELAFCAEIEWMSEGERNCVRVTNEPSQKLRIFALDVSVVDCGEVRLLEYVLPKEIQGITVKENADGAYVATLGEARVSTKSVEKLALPLRLIFEQGSGSYIGEVVIEEVNCYAYSTYSELGEAIYYMDCRTKLPRRITFNGTEYDFIWFEPIEK